MNISDEAIAYIIGEMTPKQSADFERRMSADDLLRAEVEEWRSVRRMAGDWVAEEPAGARQFDCASLRRAMVGEFALHGPQPSLFKRLSGFIHPSMKVRSAFAWALTFALILFSAVILFRSLRQTAPVNPIYVHEQESPQVEKPWGTLNFPR